MDRKLRTSSNAPGARDVTSFSCPDGRGTRFPSWVSFLSAAMEEGYIKKPVKAT